MPECSVLRRLERPERAEAATARGVADEIVSFQQRRARLAAIAHSVRTAADA